MWPLTPQVSNAAADYGAETRILPRSQVLHVGFSELRSYVLKVEGCTDPRSRLIVDDEELGRADTGRGVAWAWQPRFYAGLVRAELLDASGRGLQQFTFEVSPSATKLGRDAYGDLVRRLRQEDPELLPGAEPAGSRLGALGASSSPYVAFARLRQHADAFIAALRAIASDPLVALVHDRARVPANAVSRADRQTALAALRSPSIAQALTNTDAEFADLQPDAQFDVPRTLETLDSAANRALLAVLRMVRRRTAQLARTLETHAEEEDPSDTVSSLRGRWPHRREFLRTVARQLDRIERVRPFPDCRRAAITTAGLNAIAAHPLYARAYRLGWWIVRSGVGGEDASESVPLTTTWELFERWCYLDIVERVRQSAPDQDWQMCDNPRFRSLRQWRGQDDTGCELNVYLQPEFPSSGGGDHDGFRSISGRRIPDIVITREQDDRRDFVVVDAKYRVTRRNVLDAMTSAHVYRDALRWDGVAPALSVLAVPAGGGAPWLEDPAFIGQHGVGVIALTPSAESEDLMPDVPALREWLQC